jgi:hypothetical protein
MSETRPKAKSAANNKEAKSLEAVKQLREGESAIVARNVMSPTLRGAVATQAFSKVFGETKVLALVDELRKQCDQVTGNNMDRAEDILTTQAHTLDAIFNELARRAALNMSDHINATDRYLRLALKAQSQCRATLETLATIKNPPVIYAKQANISNGPQQVNNGTSAHVREENVNQSNELLELQHGQRLDTRTTSTAISTDTAMAPMG